MKKIWGIICGILILANSAQAQMVEELGALAVDGAISSGGYKAVGQGQKAYNRMQFQQDLTNLIAEIQMTYMGNYEEISKSSLTFSGFRGIDWNIGAEGGSFYVEFNNLDGATCFICKSNGWGARRVEINNNSCSANNNQVKMIF